MSAQPGRAPRRPSQHLLDGPVLPTLAALAAPNLLLVMAQLGANMAEGHFIGRIGTDALAGAALVFPLFMLMQMMSAGAMGGGISSAVARALGAGRTDEAESLARHALVIALGLGVVFTAGALLFGPVLYRSLGGRDELLAAALTYSNILFGGAALSWLMNSLASVVRGTGNMRVPAAVLVGVALAGVALAPPLMFGWGPVPALGIAGAASALVVSYGAGAAIFLWYLTSGRGALRLHLGRMELSARRLGDILKVGLPAIAHSILVNVSVAAITGYVGAFGTAALAGYGLGARLEYLQIPIVFAFGAALVAMVGINVGAGQRLRARRVALTGGLACFIMTGSVGLIVAVAPDLWTGLFSDDADVRAAGAAYLQRAGWVYGFLGMGMALYFAAQGAGDMRWPLFAGTVRLIILVGGGYLVVNQDGGTLAAIFLVIAIGLVAFGSLNLAGALRIFRVPAAPPPDATLPRTGISAVRIAPVSDSVT